MKKLHLFGCLSGILYIFHSIFRYVVSNDYVFESQSSHALLQKINNSFYIAIYLCLGIGLIAIGLKSVYICSKHLRQKNMSFDAVANSASTQARINPSGAAGSVVATIVSKTLEDKYADKNVELKKFNNLCVGLGVAFLLMICYVVIFSALNDLKGYSMFIYLHLFLEFGLIVLFFYCFLVTKKITHKAKYDIKVEGWILKSYMPILGIIIVKLLFKYFEFREDEFMRQLGVYDFFIEWIYTRSLPPYGFSSFLVNCLFALTMFFWFWHLGKLSDRFNKQSGIV